MKAGVSLSGITGINLSAQTRYSSTATVFFKTNGSNTSSNLCGHDELSRDHWPFSRAQPSCAGHATRSALA